jgi:hypothetical protein
MIPSFPINFIMPTPTLQMPQVNFQNPFQQMFIQPQVMVNPLSSPNSLQTPTTPVDTTTTNTEKETKQEPTETSVVLLYDDEISMEEKRALLKQYQK